MSPEVAAAGLVGLLVGSFLNVVVHRVPLGLSVVRPASRCPGCGHEVRRRDNVPVLSWVLLRGRCRDCSAPISVRYPLVELATGLLFAATAAVVGPTWALPAYLYLAGIAVPLTLIDLQVHRLPDRIVLPSYAVALVLLTAASAGSGNWTALLRALAGGCVLFLLYAVVFVVKPGGMGLGDVKLAGVLGLYLAWWGWDALAVGSFLAFLLGGLVAVPLVLFTAAGRRSKMPFGPAMLGGALLALVVAEPVGDWYLSLVGLGTA
ncbi:prepilin peptidase [Kineococcus sp. T13]|uniref:prepilin peptidase n=1 Tax=Kineococcus vitellinus TaxID=2696565 RepID=UPI001412D9D2|nr:A24 family peptidase [Kineococcus vitellinus]NAZ74896.1 prepilin peptidase [Kineococcus vitellinus]